jgi:class 3 adenylate cyclase
VIHDHRRLVAVLAADVHEAVTGRLGTTSADIGSLALRNIERPVQAFSLTPCGDHDPSDER